MALRNARGLLKEIRAKINKLKTDKDEINKRYEQLTKEKDDMHEKFEAVIMQLRQKANYKNYMLE